MPTEISEVRFEQDIEASLQRGGPDTSTSDTARVAEPKPGYGEGHPGGYHHRRPEEYDRWLCLIRDDLVGFIQATQPETWERLREHHGEDVRDTVVKRVSGEIRKRGTLSVLRDGVKMSGPYLCGIVGKDGACDFDRLDEGHPVLGLGQVGVQADYCRHLGNFTVKRN